MDGSKWENPVGLEVVCVLTPVHLAFSVDLPPSTRVSVVPVRPVNG